MNSTEKETTVTTQQMKQIAADHMKAEYGWNSAVWSYTVFEDYDGSYRVIQGSGNHKIGHFVDGVFTVTSTKVIEQGRIRA